MSSTAASEPNASQMTDQPLTTPSHAAAPFSSADSSDPSTVVLRNRGVPSAMGTVRLGGAGRSFPVAASGLQVLTTRSATGQIDGGLAARRAATVVGSAGSVASDQKRHVSLERHPSSPFGRKIELTQKLILVPDESERERFQVRKSIIKTLPHKHKLHEDMETCTSTRQKAARPVNPDTKKKDSPLVLPRSLEPQITAKATTGDARTKVRAPALATTKPAQQQATRRPPAIDTRHDHCQGFSAPMQTTKPMGRDGACRSVAGVPPDLQLFTQRTEDHNTGKSARKAFHTAFHAHSTVQDSQREAKATTIISHMPTSSAAFNKSPWRQMDESIEHIYEDPSTDFVQLKLLAHKSGESSKRQKLLERERVLAAASELREREARERAPFEELQRKKSQVEQLSEAIRVRNRKLVVVKSEPVYAIADRVGAGAVNRYDDDNQDAEPKRKPPVPRQHGRRKAQLQTRNSQLKAATEAITKQLSQRRVAAPVGSAVSNAATSTRPRQDRQQQPSQPGSVSSSILLGDSGEFAKQDVRQSIGEESQEGEASARQDTPQNEAMPPVSPPPEQSSDAEDRSLLQPHKKRARATRRTPRPHNTPVHGEEQPIPVVSKEKSERRELAREFMELQKQSRQLRSAKEKQRLEEEKQRRRLQLEKLEQERIESLRRSKKKSFKRSRVLTRAESDRHSSHHNGFRGRSETDEKSAAGFPVSDDDDAAEKFHRVADDDRSEDDDLDGDEFFASDQENQRNSRNRSFERVGGHDASVLIGYSSADEKRSPLAASAKEVDVRLRRLLELEEKATQLSMLVNGIKGRNVATPSAVSAQRAVIKEEQARENDLRFPTPRQYAGLDGGYDDQQDKASQHDEDEAKASSSHEMDAHSSGGDESEVESTVRSEELDCYSDGVRQSRPDKALGYREFNAGEAHHATDTHHDMNMHAEEVRLPASASIDVESMAAQLSYLGESHEFDLRTIGVHNIKVQWPIEHQSDNEDAAGDGGHTRVSPSHSPASSRSSSRSRRHQFDPNQLLSSPRASFDSSHSADPFEASIHSYMQQHQLINQGGDTQHEASSSHPSPRISRAELASASRHHHQRSTLSSHTTSEANEAFLRLVREADDSLSVINSTAHKIWLQQQQKLQAHAEKQRQRELEALIQEQERKNQQLQAVMDSLTSARHVSDSRHESETDEEQAEVQFEHESPSSDSLEGELPFNRLEDIMQQIEDEKLREKQVVVSSQLAHTNESQLHNSKQPAPLFWNDMLASSEPLTKNTNNSVKLRTMIDRSELLKQQTQQQHEAQDGLCFSQSYQDELKRVHSPKTLSRLLLAEVEYNDAIHEAHLQLSIMEHAQVVEQAQEETMNVATAFKEEMESNLTNHQLALEHAILSKQFDGDLQDVMQELEVIQRTQAQELVNTTASMQNELKLANRREVTVQTEELRRADVATNAKLYAETGTATGPLVCDAGVQYEYSPKSNPLSEVVDQSSLISQQPEQVQALIGGKAAAGAASADEGAYSEEEEYEEDNFECESQSVLTHDSVKQAGNKAGASSGSANSEISEGDDELGDGAVDSEHPSEVQSVVSEDEDGMVEKAKQSVAASSTNSYEDDEIHSEAYEDEDAMAQSGDEASVASSAIDEASALSDRMLESGRSDSEAPVVSASMSYEDDFDASSSQAHATAKKSDSDVGSEEIVGEEEDAKSEAHSSGSAVSDEIEDDDVPSESDPKNKSDGVVASEDSEYSSEFSSGTTKDEREGTPVTAAAKFVTLADRAMPTEIKVGQAAVMRITESEYSSVSMAAITGTDGVMPAYQRDLDQRKQSDESLLHLRLQVLERKFQMDVQAIDRAIANANGVPGKLLLRKEAFKMAFLSEKASVESLKAASMARYYQDLLAFQSLMTDVDPSISAAVVPVQRSPYPVLEIRSDNLRRVIPEAAPINYNESGGNTATDSVKNEDEDEFDSVSEKAELKMDDEDTSGDNVKSEPSVSESEDKETSEIQEDEAPSVKERVAKEVESDHFDDSDDEGDAYEDEFASVSKSDVVESAQKPQEEEDADGDAAIADDFEKEDASVKSEARSEVGSIAEDEFDGKPDSVESKDDDKSADEDKDYDDYEDEFASVSESDGAKPSSQAPATAEEDDEIMDEASEDDGGHQSEDETSQAPSENFEDDFESSGESHGASATEREVVLKAEGDLQYPNDFETSAARGESTIDESQSALKQQLDVAESIVVAATATEQSGSSEDSSTTKLLIEQVHHLQQQAEKHISEADVQHTEEKLTRKKIKAIELVQAKERLIKLEKNKFKLEEEQRQVNALAQLAIQMDVNSELSKAKEQIKQQLEAEMASVQQSFPVFAKVSEAGATTITGTPTTTQPVVDAIKVPSPAKEVEAPAMQVGVKETPLRTQSPTKVAKDRDVSEDEYEVDSFEEEQSAAENAKDDDDGGAYDEEYASYAEEEDQSQVEESKEIEKPAVGTADDEDGEIASETEDDFARVSGDGADGSEIRSEASMENDDDHDAAAASRRRDGKSEASVNDDDDASVDDYADEYEDESFDDAKSVRPTQLEDAEIQQKSGENDGEQVDEYEDEAYSEEDFEKASEVSVTESKHLDDDLDFGDEATDQDALQPVDAQPEIHSKVQEDQQQHVSIDELSTALDTVTSRLYQPAPDAASVDLGVINLSAHDVSIALQADQAEASHALPAQLSVSVSHEEEILSKSVEEQTKRLEELKQMIVARKSEILSVQKHMRIEKRKEQLTVEERLLWDEMERVEANLRMDEAALELTRQRNRLEVMRLEAKHDEHKAKLTGGTTVRSSDLLEGFDFVEAVEIPDVQTSRKSHEAAESKTKKTLWGATSDGICQTDSSLVAKMTAEYDLLTAYVYVEEVESVPVFSEATLPTVSSTMGDADKTVTANDYLSDDETEMGACGDCGDEFSASMDAEETLLKDQEVDVSLVHKTDIHHQVQEEDAAADLLSGYSYVEDVELLMEGSDVDLLVSFDFVEEVNPVDSSHEPSDQDRGLEPSQERADTAAATVEPSNNLADDDEGDDSDASESEGDEYIPPSCTKDAEDHEDDLPLDSPAYYHPEDRQQSHAPGSSADSQSSSPVTSDGVKLADRVANAIYGDLFDDIWKDSWELRRQASREMKHGQDSGGPFRELDDVEAGGVEVSVESIATDTETAGHRHHDQSYEEATHTSATTSDMESAATSRTVPRRVVADELTDTLFDELYVRVLSDGVQSALGKKVSKKQSSQRAESCAKECQETTDEEATDKTSAALVVVTSRAAPALGINRRPSAPPVADRDFVDALAQRLEISIDSIRLPAFSEGTQPAGLRSARVIYESVREIAASVYSRRATTAAHLNIAGDDQQQRESDIEALKQDVQAEMERILSLRDAGNNELKKLTHSLLENDMSDDANSDETSQDDHLYLMQTQFRTNVSHVTDHMQCNVLLAGGATTTASSTPGSLPRSFYPRTPTPRGRHSSSSSHHRPAMLLHTLLRHESAQLHDRITDLILDDLLNDTTSHGDERG